jgi:hypothetical protein
MDLALDQLALRDRNFDRFALMLIDNVVELTFHQHAQDKSHENDMWWSRDPSRDEAKLVAAALGRRFDEKVAFARSTEMISAELSQTILYLHAFRNTAYHRGVRHEGILHSLALFYFRNTCTVLASYSPFAWSSGSRDRIPLRAMKHLGTVGGKEGFEAVWERLRQVAESMGDTLISDLHEDMKRTVESVDGDIQFLADDGPEERSRKQVMIACQAWPFALSEEGKAYAAKNHRSELSVGDYVDWVASSYPWPITRDPIPSWRRRLDSLKQETNPHLALKKYRDFMSQTEDIRALVAESAAQLEAYIQHEIDVARGK